jgi:hypothetical protein
MNDAHSGRCRLQNKTITAIASRHIPAQWIPTDLCTDVSVDNSFVVKAVVKTFSGDPRSS